MSAKTRVPAVECWFTTDDDPRLIGGRGAETGSYFFPSFFINASDLGTVALTRASLPP